MRFPAIADSSGVFNELPAEVVEAAFAQYMKPPVLDPPQQHSWLTVMLSLSCSVSLLAVKHSFSCHGLSQRG